MTDVFADSACFWNSNRSDLPTSHATPQARLVDSTARANASSPRLGPCRRRGSLLSRIIQREAPDATDESDEEDGPEVQGKGKRRATTRSPTPSLSPAPSSAPSIRSRKRVKINFPATNPAAAQKKTRIQNASTVTNLVDNFYIGGQQVTVREGDEESAACTDEAIDRFIQEILTVERDHQDDRSAAPRERLHRLARLRCLQVVRQRKRARKSIITDTLPFGLWAKAKLSNPAAIRTLVTAEFDLSHDVNPPKVVRARMGTTARKIGLDTWEELYLFFGSSAASERLCRQVNECLDRADKEGESDGHHHDAASSITGTAATSTATNGPDGIHKSFCAVYPAIIATCLNKHRLPENTHPVFALRNCPLKIKASHVPLPPVVKQTKLGKDKDQQKQELPEDELDFGLGRNYNNLGVEHLQVGLKTVLEGKGPSARLPTAAEKTALRLHKAGYNAPIANIQTGKAVERDLGLEFNDGLALDHEELSIEGHMQDKAHALETPAGQLNHSRS